MSEGGFCTTCGHRVESFTGLDACPACGTRGLPCTDSDQVMVSVNWHELRVLVIWAENYAGKQVDQQGKQLAKVVLSIARRIEDQHPDRALALPLSLAGELRQLMDEHPQTQIISGNGLAERVEGFQRINDLCAEDDDDAPGAKQ
jgi:hypothetical protein